MPPDWPDSLAINAFTGTTPARGALAPGARSWPLRNEPTPIRRFLKPPPPADPRDWRDPRVGWGVVLPEPAGAPGATLASGDDAPEPIRALLRSRPGAPVLRYRADSPHRLRLLRNYRDGKDVPTGGAQPGTGPGCLPRYLLIYGGPDEIPWDLQYLLNAECSVGRLALSGEALARYVACLLDDWKDATSTPTRAVVWAVDHGSSDISHLMRNAIAVKAYQAFAADPQMSAGSVFLDGASGGATADALRAALTNGMPGLIVTTSHGMTGPLADPAQMRAQLGLPVDGHFVAVTPETLLGTWQPDGAIWYSHACCSAGSDAQTIFAGLMENGSDVDAVLRGVAALGPSVAPLPTALLGATRPLRAFVGHVEPTFDWTLRQPATGQFLTSPLVQAVYHNLFQPEPVGLAFRDWYGHIGTLYATYEAGMRAFNSGKETRADLLYSLLVARDVQSLVILGDPTACLPPLS